MQKCWSGRGDGAAELDNFPFHISPKGQLPTLLLIFMENNGGVGHQTKKKISCIWYVEVKSYHTNTWLECDSSQNWQNKCHCIFSSCLLLLLFYCLPFFSEKVSNKHCQINLDKTIWLNDRRTSYPPPSWKELHHMELYWNLKPLQVV